MIARRGEAAVLLRKITNGRASAAAFIYYGGGVVL
jgi:hypothetical protein